MFQVGVKRLAVCSSTSFFFRFFSCLVAWCGISNYLLKTSPYPLCLTCFEFCTALGDLYPTAVRARTVLSACVFHRYEKQVSTNLFHLCHQSVFIPYLLCFRPVSPKFLEDYIPRMSVLTCQINSILSHSVGNFYRVNQITTHIGI